MKPYLGNIAYWCARFSEMRAFYTEILGLEELASGDRPRNWVLYGNEAFSFSLNQAEFTPEEKGWSKCPMDPGRGDEWGPYVTIYVPDLAAVMERCSNAGIIMHGEEPFSLGDGFGSSIEVKDPDGNTVALTER